MNINICVYASMPMHLCMRVSSRRPKQHKPMTNDVPKECITNIAEQTLFYCDVKVGLLTTYPDTLTEI